MEKKPRFSTVDGNTAAAHVAYAYSEVAAIYPITPSSSMGEMVDEWSGQGRNNVFGNSLSVVEMQSEGGAAGALHGSLSAGSLTTTFTASQGLLLMIPNMYKIAGEMLPTVFHVSARSLACQSLSIFGDHSDVMACRQTGFAMLASSSVQEAHDMAIIAHLSSLEASIPFLHFFDGFRTSQVVEKAELADYDVLSSLLDNELVRDFKKRSLSPDHPVAKVGAQNPDVYFQGRETVNKYYEATPAIVKKYMKAIEGKFGRKYSLYSYVGHPEAENIIVSMGSSCETIEETVNSLNARGERVGAIKVHLFRPFSLEDFRNEVPKSVKRIAVLDRTKEPGSIGEPLYMDVVAAFKGTPMTIIGGRYGLASKDFTPCDVKAVFDHLRGKYRHDFTVGITDDVTFKSIEVFDSDFDSEPSDVKRCKFWGLGSDGTVSANKNSIKIIGDNTDMFVQAYFEYDSKKSGGTTVSHLRFGNKPIKSQYLITHADFIALHNPSYIGRYDILDGIIPGGVFLINAPWKREEAFYHLSEDMQKTIQSKKVRLFVIDASKIAKEVGLPGRVSTVMQAAFFKISGILPEDQSITLIKNSIHKTLEKKGESVIKMNYAAVDKASQALVQVDIPLVTDRCINCRPLVVDDGKAFTKEVIESVIRLKGSTIPVSKMSFDGKVPTGTSSLEKRGVAEEVPLWIKENCIQCAQCSFVCPHAAIRAKQIEPKSLVNAPKSFVTLKSATKNERELLFRIQVYPDDCIGCGSCVEVCPAKNKAIVMTSLEDVRSKGETLNVEFFNSLPNDILDGAAECSIKGSQLKQPLFEFSGACAGCGETPYIKLVTQLFGDRMIIANATGCSSIYSGTFPTIPYCKNSEGKGPAWANSLFEDNAEYGYGMRLAVDASRKELLSAMKELTQSGPGQHCKSQELVAAAMYAIDNFDSVDSAYKDNAKKIAGLIQRELPTASDAARRILEKIYSLKDYIVNRSIWIIGGDGWAYDIGYGGLDHVLASGRNVKILVLDTEVYSNTGGQSSKSTPLGAVAKFASNGKKVGKKNLGLMAMSYGYVYVAQVSMGKDKSQLLKALTEAEGYPGPALVIAYSPCIAHGIDMKKSQEEEKRAVDSGYWQLYRYNPRLADEGKNPLVIDSKEPTLSFQEFLKGEIRYTSLQIQNPAEAARLFGLAEKDARRRMKFFKAMAEQDTKQEQNVKQ